MSFVSGSSFPVDFTAFISVNLFPLFLFLFYTSNEKNSYFSLPFPILFCITPIEGIISLLRVKCILCNQLTRS